MSGNVSVGNYIYGNNVAIDTQCPGGHINTGLGTVRVTGELSRAQKDRPI